VYEPLLREILRSQLIPDKAKVRSKIKVACLSDNWDSYWSRDYGTFKNLFRSAYRISGPEDFIPNTGKYYFIPILPKYTDSKVLNSFSNIFSTRTFPTSEDIVSFLERYYPEKDGKGDAWIIRVGDRIFIMNTWENQDRQEDYDVGINHPLIRRVKGRVGPHQYLIIKEMPEGIYIHANNRRKRKSSIVVSAEKRPKLIVQPVFALEKEEWDENKHELNIRLNHFLGAVNLQLTEESKK